MILKFASFLSVAAVATSIASISRCEAFRPNAFTTKATTSQLFVSSTPVAEKKTSSAAAGPPIETEEVYGTVVGDTKGASLRLDNVAISRGASSLLKNIDWSVQPNERWGIVGVNGAGKSTLLGAITGTVRMDEGHAFVHSNIRVGYLKQSVS
jgi:ABC-type multidrug transport system fused ATPase/permease subunit